MAVGSLRWPLHVYYDGACPACTAAVARVHRRDRHGRLTLVDITAPEFDRTAHGLAGRPLEEAMHVRDAEGRVVSGVDALLAIAEALPSTAWLRALDRVPGFRPLAEGAYRWFAGNRYVLTGRCAHGACARADRRPSRHVRR